jgi:hypothetical protein
VAFNFSAISFGRVIHKDEPRFDVLVTAMSLSDIWRIKSMGSLLSEIAAMKKIHYRVAERNKKWPLGFIK